MAHSAFKEILGMKCIDFSDITQNEIILSLYDEDMDEVYVRAKGHKMSNNILHINILKIPDMDLKKYLNLQKSNITILANNCWGD